VAGDFVPLDHLDDRQKSRYVASMKLSYMIAAFFGIALPCAFVLMVLDG
jgi:hypothetical protein